MALVCDICGNVHPSTNCSHNSLFQSHGETATIPFTKAADPRNAEIASLRAEHERMRETLRRIANNEIEGEQGYYYAVLAEVQRAARAALAAKEE